MGWCLTVACALPLVAQSDRWDRQVESSLDRSTELLKERGYTPAGSRFRGLLATGESEQLEVVVSAGGGYIVVGTCDDDCGELHLVLANQTGYEIDAAHGPGNAPIVRIPPPARAGTYRLKVSMSGCRVSPCRYGVVVYGKRSDRRTGGQAERRRGGINPALPSFPA